VIDEVQKQDVSDENFTKVKEILKREFETNQKENQFWLSYIYNSDYNKLDVGRLAKYTENVDKLTKNDIKEAAKKYLKKDKVMRFILNPEQ